MRKIRVRKENAPVMVQALVSNGYQASWRPGCYTTLGNGCSDPECCTQHISDGNQEQWATIETDASGRKAHTIWVEAGIV